MSPRPGTAGALTAPVPSSGPDGAVLVALLEGGQGIVVDQSAHPCAAHLLRDVLAGGVDPTAGTPHLVLAATPAGIIGPPLDRRTSPIGAGRAWPRAASDHGLTDRECEVLTLVCLGISNQEITDALFLSINTVKTYIRNLYRRIEVDGRPQAVRWGLLHGFGMEMGSGVGSRQGGGGVGALDDDGA